MLSRVAECIYWMSRYLERAQHTARLVDVYRDITLDQAGERATARWLAIQEELELPPLPEGLEADPVELIRWLSFDRKNESSIAASIERARENARTVRELISSEMWESINRLYLEVRRVCAIASPPLDGGAGFYRHVMDGVYLFQGQAESTLSHNEGWHHMRLGQHIERAQLISSQLIVNFRLCERRNGDGPADHLDWIALMKSCLALEMYCKAYSPQFEPRLVAEFLLLNDSFPFSVRFSAERIKESLDELARLCAHGERRRVDALAGRLQSTLSYTHIDDVMHEGVAELLNRVRGLCCEIHDELFATYINYPIEAALQQQRQ